MSLMLGGVFLQCLDERRLFDTRSTQKFDWLKLSFLVTAELWKHYRLSFISIFFHFYVSNVGLYDQRGPIEYIIRNFSSYSVG